MWDAHVALFQRMVIYEENAVTQERQSRTKRGGLSAEYETKYGHKHWIDIKTSERFG